MPKKSIPIGKSTVFPAPKKDRIFADTLTSEYLQELITFCQVAKQGYAICICNVPKSREDLILQLMEKLEPEGIRLYPVKLQAKDLSLGKKLRILLESGKFKLFKNSHKKLVLSITGLDDTIREEEKEFKKRPIALQGLNQQRDYFRTLSFPLLIWIPEWLAGKLPEFAPDFWVAKSVVLECLSAPEIVSQSMSQMSGAEIDFENVDEAKRKMRIYKRLIEVSKDKKAKSNFLLSLGIIHHRLGNYRKAKELYQQGLAIAQATDDKDGIARALHLSGMIHQDQGNYNEAAKKYEQSLKISEELGDKSGIAYSLGQLGNVHNVQGNYSEAQKKYEEVLRLSLELGDKSSVAKTLWALAMIHHDQGDYKEAVKKYEQSLKIAEELGNKRGIAGTLHQLGMIQQDQGDYKEAVKKYEQSLKIKQELGDKSGIARTLHQLGMIHHDQGDYKEAVKKYEQSLKITEELEDKDGIARSYGQLGRINEEQADACPSGQKDYKEAMRKYSIAFSILKELGSPDAKIAENDLIRIRKKMGEKAFEKVRKEIAGKQ